MTVSVKSAFLEIFYFAPKEEPY